MFDNLPLLKKVTWNRTSGLCVSGFEFKNCSALVELILDDSLFSGAWDVVDWDRRRRRGRRRKDGFLFFRCCKSLERLSIRNARSSIPSCNYSPCPQEFLIKFVRNAPSLQWFRSDLSKENMEMLRKERPGIEL